VAPFLWLEVELRRELDFPGSTRRISENLTERGVGQNQIAIGHREGWSVKFCASTRRGFVGERHKRARNYRSFFVDDCAGNVRRCTLSHRYRCETDGQEQEHNNF
jgi:hypothetical protein